MAAKSGPKNGLTDQHKAALAVGRNEGRIVRDYLEALRNMKGRPGRKRTAESIAARLSAIASELGSASAVRELELVQERFDLEAELNSMGEKFDISALEDGFVKVAKGYSDRKGLSYNAWRTGVRGARSER